MAQAAISLANLLFSAILTSEVVKVANRNYRIIRTPADVQEFQSISNGLHDGHITHVEYDNTGIYAQNTGLSFDYGGTNLLIHVLVTSLPGQPTFELAFHKILEWQVKADYFSDILGSSILFLEDGTLFWADDISPNVTDLKQGSYVIAESMQYRQL